MPVPVGTGPGQYPPTIQYVINGEPADDLTFNRPHEDGDARAEALRDYVDNIQVADIGGLVAALGGDAPLHDNLRKITVLDYAANATRLFAINSAGDGIELVDNLLTGEFNEGVNNGSGVEVYKEKIDEFLHFRTLIAGTNMTINQDADTIEFVSAPGEITRFTKPCKNTTGATIPQYSMVAWLDDGSIALADANEISLSDLCGITLEAIDDGNFGLVCKLGTIPNALSGLGAKPGQWIYLSETAGGMSLTPPSGLTDNVIILGKAEPPDGVATPIADALFLKPSYITEGGV